MSLFTKRPRKPQLKMDMHSDSKKLTRSFLIRDRNLEDVSIFWNKYRHLMHKALKKGLEDRVPPPFVAHYNDDTVPLTITLGITF
eukprot:12885875-Prorocentrum_lima.AAC.1